jgi:hypothetical protein
MAVDVKKVRWIAKGGSVFTEDAFPVKVESQKKPILVEKAIAFNVGQELAEHIAFVHNARLAEEKFL